MTPPPRFRRALLALATAASLCALPVLPAVAAPPTTLKDAFADDFLVGTAVNDAIVSGRDARSQALVIQQFNTITAENELKPENVHPKPGVYDFSKGDRFVAFGKAHGMFLVGHNLLWHIQTPAWMFTDAQGKPHAADAQLAVLRDHIQHVAGHYAGRIDAWDVANEVIDEDGSYRQSPWLKNVGDGDRLLREAYRYAAQATPGTELYYNDFNTEKPAKRAGIVRLVKMLQDSGVRIDGVGMQGHWGLDSPSIAEIETSIDTFAALGVKVMITELDIDVLPQPPRTDGMPADQRLELPADAAARRQLDPWPNGLPADMQQRLAQRYADLFELFRRKRDVIDRVTFWNVHDGDSWKNDYPVRGRSNYPLLFDRERQPKPAFDAVIKAAARD
ncbi:MAG TPA: endo-1,4-beta-xylanase [Stenotrophomonas sp.]|nr:endo-1,4-beta-xylanase [Stenotrophomonas sp.]